MRVAIAILSVFASWSVISASETKPDRPNFVFFLVDDLGFADVGFNKPDTFYDTPHLNAFAQTALRMTDAYAACPVCSPTRASIVTGRYPQRYGVTDYINQAGGNQPERWGRPTPMLPASYSDRLPLDEVTVAELLGDKGYATFFAGKWHLGPEGWWPEDQGFDFNLGGIDRGGPYGGKKYFSPYGNPRLEDGPDGEHLPARLAEEAASFIKDHKDQPFLTYLSFYSVHTPLIGRPDLVEKYSRRREQAEAKTPRWLPERQRHNRQVQDHPVYAAMVEAMDLAVGRVLRALEEEGVADNTVVIFFSDNGGLSTSEGHPTSNLPLRAGKGWLYEGGIREPCLIRVPGLTPQGATSDAVISSIDFLPTMLDLAGIEPPGDLKLDGVPLAGVLRGDEAALSRDAIYWHYPHYGNQGGSPGGAVRSGKWKLIEWYDATGDVELYDLQADVGETRNLARQHPEIVEKLRKMLADWRDEVGAVMPTKNENYDPDQWAASEQRADRASQTGKWR